MNDYDVFGLPTTLNYFELKDMDCVPCLTPLHNLYTLSKQKLSKINKRKLEETPEEEGHQQKKVHFEILQVDGWIVGGPAKKLRDGYSRLTVHLYDMRDARCRCSSRVPKRDTLGVQVSSTATIGKLKSFISKSYALDVCRGRWEPIDVRNMCVYVLDGQI